MLPYYCLIFNLLRLIFQYSGHPFSSLKIQEKEFSLICVNFNFSLILIIGSTFSYEFDYIILNIITCPLAYFVGKGIIN